MRDECCLVLLNKKSCCVRNLNLFPLENKNVKKKKKKIFMLKEN